MINDIGLTINDMLYKLKSKKLGYYKIDKVDRSMIDNLRIVEHLTEWQELSNIGVRVNNIYGNYSLELYNYKEQQDKIDEMTVNFYL